jgi:hypothetical protein
MNRNADTKAGKSMNSYDRLRILRLTLWFAFVLAIPATIAAVSEFRDAWFYRLTPFVFVGTTVVVGFAERQTRLRHSLPEKRFGLRTQK